MWLKPSTEVQTLSGGLYVHVHNIYVHNSYVPNVHVHNGDVCNGRIHDNNQRIKTKVHFLKRQYPNEMLTM